jgi:tetratricopeptide (TPR) repeat protein
MGRFDEEISSLRRKVRDEPRSTAFVALADLLRRSRRFPDALAALRAGFRYHPDYAPGRVVLARTHLSMGNRALAQQVLEEVAARDPENLAAGALLARLLVEDARWREARPLVERLLMAAPQDPAILALSAALPAARDAGAVPARGEDPFDRATLAASLARRGHYPRAARMWTRIGAGGHDTDDRLAELQRAIAGIANVEGEEEGPRPALPGMAELIRALDEGDAPMPTRWPEALTPLVRGLWP